MVTCLEAISSAAYKDYRPSDEGDHRTELEEFLNSQFAGWNRLIRPLTPEKRSRLLKVLLQNERFVFRKMLKFVMDNVPEVFWTETEDDAKPDYLTSVVKVGPDGLGKEEICHSDIAIHQWERIEKADLKRTLRDIYDARSRLVHEGVQFPESIVVGHFRSLPPAAVAETTRLPLPLPPLITFERLVSYAMAEFLRRQKAE